MTNKEIRKWMRQYVIREFTSLSKDRDNLISVSKNVLKINDLLALGLRDYIRSTARAVVGLNLSDMGTSEFKKEFNATDEDIKTTLLYGFLTQKPPVLNLEEDYVLGRNRKGGFKMVTIDFEVINQDKVVDLTDEFENYVKEQKQAEKELIKFSDSTTSIRSFIGRTGGVKTHYGTRKKRQAFVGMGKGVKGSKKKTEYEYVSNESIPKAARGFSEPARGYIRFENRQALEKMLSKLSPESRKSIESRIVQVGEGYEVKLITAADIHADYEVLEEELREAQEKYEKEPTEHNRMVQDQKRDNMRAHKAEVLKIWASYSGLHKKDSIASKLPGKKRDNIKMINAERKKIIESYYGERIKERDLIIGPKGEVYKVVSRYEKDTKTKKKGDVKKKVEIPRMFTRMKAQEAYARKMKKIKKKSKKV